ncbi:MAG: hypothetical protein WA231_04920 [Methylocella sp.]
MLWREIAGHLGGDRRRRMFDGSGGRAAQCRHKLRIVPARAEANDRRADARKNLTRTCWFKPNGPFHFEARLSRIFERAADAAPDESPDFGLRPAGLRGNERLAAFVTGTGSQ